MHKERFSGLEITDISEYARLFSSEVEYNANRKSNRRKLHERQKPGVSPLVYSRFLIDCAVFLALNDMGKHLPDYEEIPMALDLAPEVDEEYKLGSVRNEYNGKIYKTAEKFISEIKSDYRSLRMSIFLSITQELKMKKILIQI